MSNTIVLRGLPVDLTSATGHQFVVDCTRAGEGLLTDNDLRDKYELSDKNWEKSPKTLRSYVPFEPRANGREFHAPRRCSRLCGRAHRSAPISEK
jgi:hypothetical protein